MNAYTARKHDHLKNGFIVCMRFTCYLFVQVASQLVKIR